MKGKVFVDAGANIGYYSLYALAIGMEVVAIEPQHRAVDLIRMSVGLNPSFSERLTLHHKVKAASPCLPSAYF